jgi:kynurenine formamidase
LQTDAEGAAAIRGYMSSLRNWGRWGQDDELGTLNLVTPPRVRAAAALVEHGLAVSCARDIDPGISDVYGAPQRLVLLGGAGPDPEPLVDGLEPITHRSYGEFIGMAYHGMTITHLDAPAHESWDGRIYNGRPESVIDHRGAAASAVTAAAAGLATRGVLLDIPAAQGVGRLAHGYAVTPEDVEACERHQGIRVGAGDAVLLRTGARPGLPPPPGAAAGFRMAGWGYRCLPWLHEREVALIGSDGINDAVPSGGDPYGVPLPMHLVGLVAMGLWLLDSCDLEALAAACGRLGRWEFMLSVQPLRLAGSTGSPVNPIALF